MTQAPEQIISRDRWESFFDDLSRAYAGRSATLEVRTSAREQELLAYDEPFAGISSGDRDDLTLVIQLGEGITHTIGAPIRIRTRPFMRGHGQIVEIEAIETAMTRLYLSSGAEGSTGHGEIYGGAASGAGAAAPADADEGGEHEDPAGLGGSAGAAGGSAAAPPGSAAGGVEDDALVSFGSSDDMGGVAPAGGGSLGDRDLSGRRGYDIAADVYGDLDPETAELAGAVERGLEGEADVVDAGGEQGVIDTGIDPIEGDPIAPANDPTDSYVEGDVGAQAERDLSEPRRRRRDKRK